MIHDNADARSHLRPRDLLTALTLGATEEGKLAPFDSSALLLDTLLQPHLTPAENAFVRLHHDVVDSAFRSARQGDLVRAKDCLLAASIASTRGAPSERSTQALCAFIQSALAYISYKSGRHGEAAPQLQIAMSIDHRLVSEHGLLYFHCHRLHLAHNLLRVWLAEGRALDAEALADRAIQYLLSRRQRVLPGFPRDLPRDLSCAAIHGHMLRLFAGELAFCLLECDTGTDKSFCEQLDTFRTPPRACSDAIVRWWILSKRAHLSGRRLQAARWRGKVLLATKGRESHLWYAALAEACEAWRQFGDPDLPELLETVQVRLSSFQSLSDRFKRRLGVRACASHVEVPLA